MRWLSSLIALTLLVGCADKLPSLRDSGERERDTFVDSPVDGQSEDMTFNNADLAIDAPDLSSGECEPGLCKRCSAMGAIAPADDAACGVIACSNLDEQFVRGNEVWGRSYQDITTRRCEDVGECISVNEGSCGNPTEVLLETCEETCERATVNGCVPKQNGVMCGTDVTDGATSPRLCYDGRCARVCWINNGTTSCNQLCGAAGYRCVGYRLRSGGPAETDCSVVLGSGNTNNCYGF